MRCERSLNDLKPYLNGSQHIIIKNKIMSEPPPLPPPMGSAGVGVNARGDQVVLIPVNGGYIATAIRAVPISASDEGRGSSAASDYSQDSASTMSLRRKEPGM